MLHAEPPRKRAVIVDDSPAEQSVLEQILRSRLGYQVVGVAKDAGSAISLIAQLKPDLVTIDLAMPYINGRQLLKGLAAFPDMYKVIISASARSNFALKVSLESMGADACLCKDELVRNADEFCRMLSSVTRMPKRPGIVRPVTTSDVPRASGAGYPIPADERARLAALNAFGLANDNPDRRLDMLTKHLATTTNYAICVMTFIDQNTLWIKSGHGFDRASVPRSQGVCNHTICDDEPFIVQDLSLDSRFNMLDAVRSGPMIRSYVGYPIVSSSGVRLGSLCLIDPKPNRVSVKDLTNLRSMARVAAEVIESRAVPMTRAA